MIEYLDHIDRAVFLFLNGMHNPFFDKMMFAATNGALWIPLYLFFLFFVIRKYKWNTLLILVIVAIMILASDTASAFVKETVHRPRPSWQPGLMVHIVQAYKGGHWGFYSGHASNTFCVAIFLCMILGKRYWYVGLLAILWSVIMSYTRIYLGVHYPGDIISGWVAGSLFGLICKFIVQTAIHNPVGSDSKFNETAESSAEA